MATLQTEMSAPTTTTTTPNTSPQTSAPSTPRITSSLLSPNTSPSSSPFSSSPSTPKMPPSEPSLPKDPKPKPQTYEQMMAEINAATALEGYDAKGLYHSTASNAPILIKEAAPVVFKQRYGEDRLVYAGVGRLGDWDDEEGDGDEAGESLKKKEGKGKGGVTGYGVEETEWWGGKDGGF
ncbi:hypothetical protein GLAREA_03195 [Glarea lozoyensis ATCC 20868]|uniref:Uncharacterized protein n=1 Tax=Glarea lozoyensis (strain ATCC 20868 / MF5171) TaxID=1116229 RepID=S3CNL0_GLAL2|nr:uncharacterized protein GLAREA_03195 [Glarea lozoyensis ATCC 20868]EPE27280.1 hypothetical protein GLAREA_03195 [Glarea lozoyensis ATCC 20868]